VVSSTTRPHLTPGKDPIPILQEAGWAPEPVWTGGKTRPHRDSIPDRPARSQSLYRLSYPAHIYRVSQEECARLREGVPYVKVYRYNPKHLCPKWNGYGKWPEKSVVFLRVHALYLSVTMLPLSALSVVSYDAISAGRWAVNFTA